VLTLILPVLGTGLAARLHAVALGRWEPLTEMWDLEAASLSDRCRAVKNSDLSHAKPSPVPTANVACHSVSTTRPRRPPTATARSWWIVTLRRDDRRMAGAARYAWQQLPRDHPQP
jgi:hypothetical protein